MILKALHISMLMMIQLPGPANADATPEAFTCPVTSPTDSRPEKSIDPFDEDAALHHEDELWVTIPANGIIELSLEDTITFGLLTGWRSETVAWLREDGVEGFVDVTGQRLDTESELSPQTPLSPQRQYVRIGPVTTGLAFPSEGCWEITGSVGNHQITWVADVRFIDHIEATPTP